VIRVSAVAAVLSTVDVPYAVSVSKVSGVPAFVGVLLLLAPYRGLLLF
jgi:hypothetical protein